jgi:MFS family permease
MTAITDDARRALLGRIQGKRRQVDTFVRKALPRKRRLLNVTIVGGTLAAAFTAGPAAGGPTFTGWLTSTFGLTAPAWQLLCGAAAVCSVAATISTQLLKTQHVEEHVARAQSCRAKLEVLEIGLTTGHLDTAQATTEFIRCVEEVSFLEQQGSPAPVA